MKRFIDRSGGGTRRLVAVLGTAATLMGTAGCSGILDAELPGRIPTELLDDPTVAATLATSVVADFECAYSNYVASVGIMSDQFLGASGNANAKDWGTKNIVENNAPNATASCAANLGAYTPLQTARFQSEDIAGRLAAWTDQQAGTALAPLIARTKVIGAYAYLLLGEGYCAMRFDRANTILTPAQVLAIAETKFSEAITAAGGVSGDVGAQLLNLARVGRARTRLNLKNNSGAAADAALVTAGFTFSATRSADINTRNNDAFVVLTEQGHGSVAPEFRSLTVGGTADPRVVVRFGPDVNLSANAFDGVTPLYVVTNKNFSRADPMRVASAIEAELIRAEALGGQQAVDIVNARRAALSLPPYTGATDDAAVRTLILDERNREFFMEGGQRTNDLLRHGIQWKVGNDQIGRPYGPASCLPLPIGERVEAGG